MNEVLWSVGRVAIASYVGLLLFMYFRQARYVFYPTRGIAKTPATAGLSYEDVMVKTSDGETVHGWFVPASSNAAGTLLFCHGNAGNIWSRIDGIWLYHDMGFNVCIFDYRGYGRSSGAPSEEGTYRDAEAVWNYLVGVRGIPPETIVVFGESLGGAVATHRALQDKPGALILESTFTSLPDMAARLYPFFPVRWFCRYRYDTLDRLPSVRCPVLVAHSRNDEMIPYAQGRRLFEAAPEPKEFLEMKGSHNTAREESAVEYEQTVRSFVGRHLKPVTPGKGPESAPAGAGDGRRIQGQAP